MSKSRITTRPTLEDTVYAQEMLTKVILSKINGKKPFIDSDTNMFKVIKLIGYALLSQGPMSRVVPFITVKEGNREYKIPLGRNVHHFGLMLAERRSSHTKLSIRDKVFEVGTEELWKRFYVYCKELFPNAQAEALSKSAEVRKMGRSTGDFIFDADAKMDYDKK